MFAKLKTITGKPEFKEIVASLVFFYFMPILLLAYGIVPSEARHAILVFMSLIMVAYAISKPIPAKDLGFRRDNLKDSLALSGLATALLLGALFIASQIGILEPKYLTESPYYYIFYIFMSVPLQEFVFRSLMFHELSNYFKSAVPKVIISAVIFSFAHYTYRDLSVLTITFVIGIIWGLIYLKRPNFWAVALSHAILGVATVYLGFV